MMSKKKAWMAGLMAQGFNVRAVTFDGTNDYLTRGADLTGNADSKVGILSVWVKLGADGSALALYREGNGRLTIQRDAGDKYSFELQTTVGVVTFEMYSSSSWTISDGWHHILASWDLATASRYLYINDTDDIGSVPTNNNNNIDYTQTGHVIGALTSPFSNKFNGDMAQFYFNNATSLDLSVEANRRKFISADGKPVDVGVDGSLPTGTAPRIYLDLASGDAVSTFATNKGTGGGMTLTGTLAEASTSPSD